MDTVEAKDLLKVRIERPIKARAKVRAKACGRSLSQHVRELIRSDLGERQPGKSEAVAVEVAP